MFKKSVVSVVMLAVLGVACSTSENPQTKSAGGDTATAQSSNQNPTSGQLPVVTNNTNGANVAVASPVRLLDNGAVEMRFSEVSEGGYTIGATTPVTIAPEVFSNVPEGTEVPLTSVILPVTHSGQSFDVQATAKGKYDSKKCAWIIVWEFKPGLVKGKKAVDTVIVNRMGELEIIRTYTLELQKVLIKTPSKVKVCPIDAQKPGKDLQLPVIDAQKPGKDLQLPVIDAQKPGKDLQLPVIDAQTPGKGKDTQLPMPSLDKQNIIIQAPAK